MIKESSPYLTSEYLKPPLDKNKKPPPTSLAAKLDGKRGSMQVNIQKIDLIKRDNSFKDNRKKKMNVISYPDQDRRSLVSAEGHDTNNHLNSNRKLLETFENLVMPSR